MKIQKRWNGCWYIHLGRAKDLHLAGSVLELAEHLRPKYPRWRQRKREPAMEKCRIVSFKMKMLVFWSALICMKVSVLWKMFNFNFLFKFASSYVNELLNFFFFTFFTYNFCVHFSRFGNWMLSKLQTLFDWCHLNRWQRYLYKIFSVKDLWKIKNLVQVKQVSRFSYQNSKNAAFDYRQS